MGGVEREQILVGLMATESYRSMGRRLGRAASTIKREVDAGGGRGRYLATAAQDAATERARRPKPGVLVERSTRLVMLMHLPADRRAETVRDAVAAKITALPETVRRSLTWDQGREMARHVSFTVATGSRSTSATRTAPGNAALRRRSRGR